MAIQIGAVRILLQRLRTAIRQEQNNALLATKGKRQGDPQEEAFWRKLAGYDAELRRIHRDLTEAYPFDSGSAICCV